MNLNRDNYETFFLLYIDNELSLAERKAVEEFAALHPDLQEELELLSDTILVNDPVIFSDKIELLKPADLEEKLLLHLDNELPAAATEDLNKMIASNAVLQQDWNILQQAKLDAGEKIIFKDKQSLYRREKDNVVAGRFIRWAVAAALIGAGFFTAMTLINRRPASATEFAGNKTAENNLVSSENTKKEATTEKSATAPFLPQATNNNDVALQKKSPATTPAKQPLIADKQNNAAVPQKEDNRDQPAIATVQKQLPENGNSILTAATDNKDLQKPSPERPYTGLAAAPPRKKVEIMDVNILDVQPNSLASNAGFHEDNDDDRILYLKEEDVSKSKAGGFFRKLKRTVERKTRIKTNGGLKIAGFEIALN